jgi:hypothetical protein
MLFRGDRNDDALSLESREVLGDCEDIDIIFMIRTSTIIT